MFFLRFFSFFALAVAIVFAPAVFILFFVALAAAFLPKFLEGVIIGVIMDSFYVLPSFFEKFNVGFFIVLTTIVVLFSEALKHFIQGRNFISNFVIAALNWAWIAVLFFFFL